MLQANNKFILDEATLSKFYVNEMLIHVITPIIGQLYECICVWLERLHWQSSIHQNTERDQKQVLMREWAGATSGTDRVKSRAQCGALLLPTRALVFRHAVRHKHCSFPTNSFERRATNLITLEFHATASQSRTDFIPRSYRNAVAKPGRKHFSRERKSKKFCVAIRRLLIVWEEQKQPEIKDESLRTTNFSCTDSRTEWSGTCRWEQIRTLATWGGNEKTTDGWMDAQTLDCSMLMMVKQHRGSCPPAASSPACPQDAVVIFYYHYYFFLITTRFIQHASYKSRRDRWWRWFFSLLIRTNLHPSHACAHSSLIRGVSLFLCAHPSAVQNTAQEKMNPKILSDGAHVHKRRQKWRKKN